MSNYYYNGIMLYDANGNTKLVNWETLILKKKPCPVVMTAAVKNVHTNIKLLVS